MGIFAQEFGTRVVNLWHLAHSLNKPIANDITWAVGICNGRTDFADLQAHGIALASSIIINEPVVPRIMIGWDTHINYNDLYQRGAEKLRKDFYPHFMLSLFPAPEIKKAKYTYEPLFYTRETKYALIAKNSQCIGGHPYGLGLGYRAKYLGMEYVTTQHAVLSDIDTICLRPCIEQIRSEIKKNPKTFCLTSWYDEKYLSVGLCVYNMAKYRMLYKPLMNRMNWNLQHADSEFVQAVRRQYPRSARHLDLRLIEKDLLNTEKFYQCMKRENFWNDDKTAHYHAWKGELRKNKAGFIKFYGDILSDLERNAQCQ